MSVSYTYDHEFDLYIAFNEDDYQLAGIEEKDGKVYVSYGPFMAKTRKFPNLEEAKEWIETHQGDLADPDTSGRL